ncbi:hypothetical protein niasHT_008159 [Heterodera trifolii]|uniref:Uncharacterized protein n=1 Tax=Heterodera trifolii TaxID=157864 RepID=A0ABD2M196_9BILA
MVSKRNKSSKRTLLNSFYKTSQCLAFSVGMSHFSFGTFILLSVLTWCCFFMPPVAVFFSCYLRDRNTITIHFFYNIVFCCFLWVPGIVHALRFCFSDILIKDIKEAALHADSWLKVFKFLHPSQLGLQIALLSHRFKYFVEVHFKSRKWTFGVTEIQSKIGPNGEAEIEIAKNGISLPIPQNPPPKGVVGFERVWIHNVDTKILDFLDRFRPLLTASQIYLSFPAFVNNHTFNLFLLDHWPFLRNNIRKMYFSTKNQIYVGRFDPPLIRCQALRFVRFDYGDLHFPTFRIDGTDESLDNNWLTKRALADWLFSPRQGS